MTLNRSKTCFPPNNSALKRWFTLFLYIHIYLFLLKTFFSTFKCSYFLYINALPYNITQIILELLIISKYSVHSSYSCHLVKYSFFYYFFYILCSHMEHSMEHIWNLAVLMYQPHSKTLITTKSTLTSSWFFNPLPGVPLSCFNPN